MGDYISNLEYYRTQLTTLPLKDDVEKLIAWEAYNISGLLLSKNFGTIQSETGLFPIMKQFMDILYNLCSNKTNQRLFDAITYIREIIFTGGKNVD